ncbi:MAG: response regulator [Pyrinomonadaceae bacterium]
MTKVSSDKTEFRVLLLTPTPRDANLITAILKDVGIAYHICSDVLKGASDARHCCRLRSAAIDTTKKLRPDVLISDVGLPGQDGYEMMHTIRTLPEIYGGRTLAIALTGHVSVQDRKRAIASGFQAHLAKPIDLTSSLTVSPDGCERLSKRQFAPTGDNSVNIIRICR